MGIDPNVLAALAKGSGFNPLGAFSEGLTAGAENGLTNQKTSALKSEEEDRVRKRNALNALGASMNGVAGKLMAIDPDAAVAYMKWQQDKDQFDRRQKMVADMFGDGGALASDAGGGEGPPLPQPQYGATPPPVQSTPMMDAPAGNRFGPRMAAMPPGGGIPQTAPPNLGPRPTAIPPNADVGAPPPRQPRQGQGPEAIPALYNAKAKAEAMGFNDIAQGLQAKIDAIKYNENQGIEGQKLGLLKNEGSRQDRELQLKIADDKRKEEKLELEKSAEQRLADAQELDQLGGAKRTELAQKIATEGYNSQLNKDGLHLLRKVTDQPDFLSGNWTKLPREAQRMLSQFNITPGANSNEVFSTIQAKLVKDELGRMDTGVSNTDLDFINQQFPNMDISKMSNQMIIDIRLAISDRKEAVAKLAADYKKATHKRFLDSNWDDHLAQWTAAQPSMFKGIDFSGAGDSENVVPYDDWADNDAGVRIYKRKGVWGDAQGNPLK